VRRCLPDCPPPGPAEAAAFGGAVLTTCATRSEIAPQHRRESMGWLGHHHDDEGDRAVVYLGGPIRSGYVLIPRAHLVNVDQPGARAVEAANYAAKPPHGG